MMEPIPQTGENVEALKAIAAKIKVPDGFKVNLYAASFPTPATWRSDRRAW